MSKESAAHNEGLPDYRAIDPTVHVGHIPLEQCLALQEAVQDAVTIQDQGLGVDVQLDGAWIGLEASMAMVRQTDPQGRPSFSSKEIAVAVDQVKTDFRSIIRSEHTPPTMRARAGLALASVATHHEMARGAVFRMVNPNHEAYLRGIQAAAKVLLAEENHTAEDDDLLRSMTSLAMLTEFAAQNGWFLPAAPRQPWSINAISRPSGRLARVIVADEAPAGLMPIPTEALGDRVWTKQGPDVPHATLRQYMKVAPGFAKQRGRRNAPVAFDVIAGLHLACMNGYEDVHPSTVPESAAVTSAMSEPLTAKPERAEVIWYLAQSARDFRDLNQSTLRIHILNLEEAQAQGLLEPAQQHILGWMQLERARAVTVQAQEKRLEAERARTQASRVSRSDAPGFIAAAAGADETANRLLAEARGYFDIAESTFRAAAQAAPKEKVGDSFEMLLSAEATPVYKALFTEADAAPITDAVAAYVRRLAALYVPMRRAEHTLKRDLDQLDALHAAALKATLCLLVSGSSDETARDLALPASFRAGGMQAEMDIVIFPIDYMNDNYDREHPVNLQLTSGREVRYEHQYVAVGLELLGLKSDRLGLLAKLVAPAAANKPRPSKGKKVQKRSRSETIDDIAYRITNAIADAQTSR